MARLEALHLTGDLPVLVVAADEAFRRSLVFALEVEGFGVVAYPRAAPAMARLAEAACVVLDEDAMPETAVWSRLVGLGRPVILLIDSAAPPHAADNLAILRKPLFGNVLVEKIATLTGRD